MYTHFAVKAFRGFASLELPDLKRVNLFVGKNNVGKTSLLEAIFLHAGPHNAQLPLAVSLARGLALRVRSARDVWGWLFHNARTGSPIHLEGTDEGGRRQTVTIRMGGQRGSTELRTGSEGQETSDVTLSSRLGPTRITVEYETWDGEQRASRAYVENGEVKYEHGEARGADTIQQAPAAKLASEDVVRFTQIDAEKGDILLFRKGDVLPFRPPAHSASAGRKISQERGRKSRMSPFSLSPFLAGCRAVPAGNGCLGIGD